MYKLKKISDFLCKNIFVILIFLALISLLLRIKEIPILAGEVGLIELSQVLFLCLGITVILKKRKSILSINNNSSFYMKVFMFLFLIYEEISFLTFNEISYLNSFNNQSELNLHNLNILYEFYINIPFLGNASLKTIILILFISIISFGSFVPSLKKINLLFFEKRHSFFAYIFISNLLFSSILRHFQVIGFTHRISLIIDIEIIELFFYIILFLDSCYKVYLIEDDFKYSKSN